MKNKMIKFSFLLISAVAFFLVVNKFLCTPKGVVPEIIDVEDINILEIQIDSLRLDISVIAVNKNNSEIEVVDIYFNLLTGNDTIGNAVRYGETIIDKLDTAEINFIANLSTVKSIELASKEDQSVNLRMLGKATADLGIISLPVDFDITHTFDLKDKLTETIEKDVRDNRLLAVGTAKLKSLRLNSSTVTVEFTLTNPYGIDIVLKGYPSQIYINDNHAGEGDIKSEVLLKQEKSDIKGTVIYELSNVETLTSLFGSILKRKLAYRTTGILNLEVLGYKIHFPYSFRGDLIKL